MTATTTREAVHDRACEAWTEWRDILCEPETRHEVCGERLTPQDYKEIMQLFFLEFGVKLVQFQEITLEGGLTAICCEVDDDDTAPGESGKQQIVELVAFLEDRAN